MKRIIILLFALSFFSHLTRGQAQESSPHFYIELRPLQFIMDGYSIVGHYALNETTQIGATVFSSTLSSNVTDFIWDTEGSFSLEAKQNIVLSLSYRRFLNKAKPNQGWFVGLAAGVEYYTLTNLSNREELDYDFYFLAPRLGHMLYPLKYKLPNFFISLEAVVVFPIITDGTANFSNGATAEINNVLPSPLIGLGYRF